MFIRFASDGENSGFDARLGVSKSYPTFYVPTQMAGFLLGAKDNLFATKQFNVQKIYYTRVSVQRM